MQELYLSGVVFVNTEGFRGVLAAYDAAHTLRYGCNLLRRVLPVTDVVHWLAASRAARKERGRKEGGKLSLAGDARSLRLAGLRSSPFHLSPVPGPSKGVSFAKHSGETFLESRFYLSFGSRRDTHRNHRAAFVFPSSKTRCGTNRTCMYTEYLMVMVTAVFVCV